MMSTEGFSAELKGLRGEKLELAVLRQENATLRRANEVLQASNELLLSKGADVHAKDEGLGFTALIWAATRGHLAVAALLLENGADVDAKSERDRDQTALLVAAQQGYLDVVELLLENGADVNATIESAYQSGAPSVVVEHHTIVFGSMRQVQTKDENLWRPVRRAAASVDEPPPKRSRVEPPPARGVSR